jgi:small-conductance mechanosensitive channel
VRQEVSLNIMIILKKLGLEIAFPSQSIYLKREEAENPPPSVAAKPETA